MNKSLLIPKLEPNTHYYIRVSAWTKEGEGPDSDVIEVITPISPDVIKVTPTTIPFRLTEVKSLSTGERTT